MNENYLFTPESILEFERRISEATGPGQCLLERYREDREAQVETLPISRRGSMLWKTATSPLLRTRDFGLGWRSRVSLSFQHHGLPAPIMGCSSAVSSRRRCLTRSA